MKLSDTYTRVNVQIEIKGYPQGKLCKLHFWLDGLVLKSDIQKYIDDELKFNIDFVSKEDIERCYVHKVFYTNSRNEKEDFGNVVLDSTTVVVPNTPKGQNGGKNNNQKPNKPKLKNFVISDTDTAELVDFSNRIEVELFKRKYELSDNEYIFYNVNKDIIDVSKIKETFKQYKGDAFKLRKLNIRKNLTKNPLSN